MFNWLYKQKVKFLIAGILFLICLLIIYTLKNVGVSNRNSFSEVPVASVADIQDGRMLASKYCQSCHMLPEPSLLTKEMWYTGVLPRMGPFLGYTFFRGQPYERANDVSSAYFPAKPVIDSVKWSHIIAWYINSAPGRMPEQKKSVNVIRQLPFFEVKLPQSSFFYGTISMTSIVKIDTTVRPRRLLVGDGMASRFIVLNDHLQTQSSSRVAGPIVDLDFSSNRIFACSIGTTMEANNLHNGQVRAIAIDPKGKITPDSEPLFDHLARPVKINHADLNGDGKMDYIISQFGNLVGDLSWMENKGNGKFEKHLLRDKSGALNTIIQDVNHDGKPDIWAQFAQGDESIFLYTNKGHGKFEEKRVLRFPPSYGSTSFDVADFDQDGYPDIIYTCGDNGDYTPILKPYHGVYIFTNDSKNNFRQKYFYPINGCYKAIARDFDGDDDLDIATISFFPSDAQPEEAFIYLENKGNFNFQPYSLLPGTPFQKGITMDAGDLDGNGKPDLIIGNGCYTSDSTSTHKEPLFIVLKNKSIKRSSRLTAQNK
ncbi:MAG: VCBS repeat-containing protein [Sphingobacteriaceae bacterium]|nr:MAG: VCBS repeat-containing protein [Sphingobacteriaceae bacterium]